jgi:hypothetical protein
MDNSLNICIKVDESVIYEFMGKMDKCKMVGTANHIEQLLEKECLNRDKIKTVFELFVETIQNVLSYSYQIDANEETDCHFSLSYFTEDDYYIFESCNLIHESQKVIINEKLDAIKGLTNSELRKLVRQKSRSAEDRHEHGAGLGYIVMARKSTAPIEVSFQPYQNDVLIYKQKLYI